MTGKIHVIAGVTTLSMLCVKYPHGFELLGTTVTPVISLLTATAGSYAPDIDMGRTHAGMKHKVTSTVVSKVGGGHRGITHTLLVPVICVLLLCLASAKLDLHPVLKSFSVSLLFGWLFGYVLHLFADLFNGKGIPLFWPVLKGKVHIMDIESNGWRAWLWLVCYTACMFCLTFKVWEWL